MHKLAAARGPLPPMTATNAGSARRGFSSICYLGVAGATKAAGDLGGTAIV